jgi:hypothetical protein
MTGYPISEGQAPHKKGSGRKSKYPFDKLTPGTYFVVPCSKEEHRRTLTRLSVGAYQWCRRRGIPNQFVCRTLPEGIGVFKLGETRLLPEDPNGDDFDRQ